MRRPRRNTLWSGANSEGRIHPSARRSPTHGDCTISRETRGSGVRVGFESETTRTHHGKIRKAPRRGAGYFAAEAGTTIRPAAEPPSASAGIKPFPPGLPPGAVRSVGVARTGIIDPAIAPQGSATRISPLIARQGGPCSTSQRIARPFSRWPVRRSRAMRHRTRGTPTSGLWSGWTWLSPGRWHASYGVCL